ncbi:hypothetical protein HDU86_002665 [Geranomyces michiganensis]|nr:hypothetical protein HDU86_002665 [Geranomyces michiganensis]
MGPSHRPRHVHSFGSLTHFRRDRKPTAAGAATRCTECAHERDCPYSAPRLYLDRSRQDERGWPASVLQTATTPPSTRPSTPPSPPTTPLVTTTATTTADEFPLLRPALTDIEDALANGPYGVCVYESSNDVCDHQVVNVEFDGGATASFTMVAFTTEVCERITRVHGSRGQIVGDSNTLRVTDFVTGVTRTVVPDAGIPGVVTPDGASGHGGGDFGLVERFVKAVADGDQAAIGCTPREALLSHLLVFAAEEARRGKKVVDMDDFSGFSAKAD